MAAEGLRVTVANSNAVRIRGKRKKKIALPNVLFIKWITEWRDEARTKGSKLSSTYGKALESLKKYPLHLKSGKECIILQNFGPKLCSMLDAKLDQHIKNGGSLDEVPAAVDDKPPARKKSVNVESGVFHLPATGSGSQSSAVVAVDGHFKQPKASKKRLSSVAKYIPSYRSGAYAILVALYNYIQIEKRDDFMRKGDLLRLAQPHCDKSLTEPESGSRYTAFSSMSTLVKKSLVTRTGNPARYQLTDDGVELAKLVLNAVSNSDLQSTSHQVSAECPQSSQRSPAKLASPCVPGNTQCLPQALTKSVASASSQRSGGRKIKTNTYSAQADFCRKPADVEAVPLLSSHLTQPNAISSNAPIYTHPPGSYEILLIVDNREHFGSGHAKKYILPSLAKNNVKFDVRPLSIGDFVWVARSSSTAAEKQLSTEVVLDFIVERKRLDDLAGSIMDGRYREQKMRMKSRGLRKPIYLTEYAKTQQHEKLSEDTLQQAVMNTQIIEGFFIKRCEDIKATVAYLTLMTRYLIDLYANKTIHCFTRDNLPDIPYDPRDMAMSHLLYEDFNCGAVKTKAPSVKEAWQRVLTVIPGMSAEKSKALADTYPTASSLMDAYRACRDAGERDKLIASIKSGKYSRRFGEVLSRNVTVVLGIPNALK